MSFISSRKQNLLPDHDSNKPIDSTTTTQPSSYKSPMKDKLQSLGILAMIMLIIMIGFQMTDSDVYNDLNKQSSNIAFNTNINTTPTPLHVQIKNIHHQLPKKIIVHEDDGDVEVDVPQQLPDSSSSEKQKNKENTSDQSAKKKYMMQQKRIKMLQRLGLRTRNRTRGMQHNATTNTNINNTPVKPRNMHSGPIINIRAAYHDSKEDNIILPSIEQMSKNNNRRFYSSIDTPAKLYGYDLQCTKNKCPRLKYSFISGLYNTGTNVVYRLIAPNCMSTMRFQPGWGKHEMFDDKKIKYFNTFDHAGSPKGIYKQMMLIVVIKDPLTWFKSMCKANYDFRYFNRSWFFNDCPTGIINSKFDWLPMNRGKIMNLGRNRTSNGIFESPIHLWNEWYKSAVFKVNGKQWPYLIVRFEDLLFRVDSVVPQLCSCVGQCKYRRGVDKKHIKVADAASKPHGHPRNRTMSFYAYSDPAFRYDGYTKEDLQYMLDVLDPRLLKMFGYEFNVEKTLRMRL